MSDEKRNDREPVIAKLKGWKAAKLELTLADGTVKKVAMPKSGNRWAKLTEILESVDWHFMEAQDADGGMLGRIECDDDGGASEDGFDDEGNGCCPNCGRKSESKVLLEVMRMTQRETRLGFADVIAGMSKVMEQNGTMTANMHENYSASMKLRDGMAVAEQATGGGIPPEFVEMIKMYFMLNAQGKLPPMPGAKS